jgi:hypothetical protein
VRNLLALCEKSRLSLRTVEESAPAGPATIKTSAEPPISARTAHWPQLLKGDDPADVGHVREECAQPPTLRSYTMRRPCRVSQGSTCSIVSEYGAMSELNPPVATTVDSPSSFMKRRASPSTRPAKP